MTQWWGEPWPHAFLRAPICEDDTLRRPVPVGEPCMQCEEMISESDQGVTMAGMSGGPDNWQTQILHAHQECHLRSVMGCSASLRGEPHDHEVPYREDARRVQQWIKEHG